MERRILVAYVADGSTAGDIKKLIGLTIPEKQLTVEEVQEYPFERSVAFDAEILYWYNELVYFLSELDEYQDFALIDDEPEVKKKARVVYSIEDLAHLAAAIVDERMESNEKTEERNQTLRSHIDAYFNGAEKVDKRVCILTSQNSGKTYYLSTDAPDSIISRYIVQIQETDHWTIDDLEEVLSDMGYQAEWFEKADTFYW